MSDKVVILLKKDGAAALLGDQTVMEFDSQYGSLEHFRVRIESSVAHVGYLQRYEEKGMFYYTRRPLMTQVETSENLIEAMRMTAEYELAKEKL